MFEVNFLRNVLKPQTAEIAVEDTGFGPPGNCMPKKGPIDGPVKTAFAFFVDGIDTDVTEEQVELAVSIEVEKNRARGVADIAQTGSCGNVLESSAAEIVKEHIALSHRGDKKVWFAVVVDVCEGSRHTNSLIEADSG